MTDNEIVKALEICGKGIMFSKHDCKKCPYYTELNCETKCKQNALDLINRQKKELEKNENIIRIADKTIETANAEIDRLKAVNDSFTDIGKLYSEIKSEAYKKCIEMAKEELCDWAGADNSVSYPRIERVLDKLLNEFVGDEK